MIGTTMAVVLGLILYKIIEEHDGLFGCGCLLLIVGAIILMFN